MSTLTVQNITDGTTTKSTSLLLNAANQNPAEVGTYAFLYLNTLAVTGQTYSGANLSYSPAGINIASNVTMLANVGTTVGVGTWRCMSGNTGGGPQHVTLFLRVA